MKTSTVKVTLHLHEAIPSVWKEEILLVTSKHNNNSRKWKVVIKDLLRSVLIALISSPGPSKQRWEAAMYLKQTAPGAAPKQWH